MPTEQKQTRGKSPCRARFVHVLCCTLQAIQKRSHREWWSSSSTEYARKSSACALSPRPPNMSVLALSFRHSTTSCDCQAPTLVP